jgi:hypothetical protein
MLFALDGAEFTPRAWRLLNMKRQLLALAVFATAILFAVGYGIGPAAARNGGGGGGGGGHVSGGSGGHAFSGGGGHAYSGGHSGGRSFSGHTGSRSGRSFSTSRSLSGHGSRHSGARSYGYRHAGRGHHRHHGHFVGVPFVYGYSDYYDYGSCGYYYRRAIATGSSYWWDRYYDCID